MDPFPTTATAAGAFARSAASSDGSRWVGVARCTDSDPEQAGRAVVAAALDGRDASLVLVFCPHTYDLPVLMESVRSALPAGVPLAGCTTDGQLVGPGVQISASQTRQGITALALGGPGFEVSTVVARDASGRRREAGAEAALAVETLSYEYRTCLLISDGLTREQHEIVRGAYSAVGATVAVVGGCSGDAMLYECTYQFYGDHSGIEILTDSLIGIGLGSRAPLGIGIAHGWSKDGEPMVVTSSSGGRVFRLDNEPALDAYLRRLGQDRSLLDDPETFRLVAFRHPLGMSRRSGEDIRVVHDGDPADGSLLCLADVPQGALAWLMRTDSDDLVSAAAAACRQAVEGLGGREPIGVLIFDCGARKVMLGQAGVPAEIEAIGEAVQGAPFTGFYTYGEMARTHGARGMHHLTVVTLAIG